MAPPITVIRKAVIPAAGKGTRLLPLTKSTPKEMLPLGRKPVLQHIVDELLDAGIERILFVVSEEKQCISKYFADGSDRYSTAIQAVQKGLADAVLQGEEFADGEPVAIALGDSVISSGEHRHVMQRLLEAHQAVGAACTIAVEEVPIEDAPRYGIVHPRAAASDVFQIDDLVEKPSQDSLPSNLAIAGRYVLDPAVYDAIRRLSPGAGGELQLTDAIKKMLHEGKSVWCVKLRSSERRRDIGTFGSYFEALVDACCSDDEFGERMIQLAQSLRSGRT